MAAYTAHPHASLEYGLAILPQGFFHAAKTATHKAESNTAGKTATIRKASSTPAPSATPARSNGHHTKDCFKSDHRRRRQHRHRLNESSRSMPDTHRFHLRRCNRWSDGYRSYHARCVESPSICVTCGTLSRSRPQACTHMVTHPALVGDVKIEPLTQVQLVQLHCYCVCAPNPLVALYRGFWDDLEWWISFLPSSNGVSVWPRRTLCAALTPHHLASAYPMTANTTLVAGWQM